MSTPVCSSHDMVKNKHTLNYCCSIAHFLHANCKDNTWNLSWYPTVSVGIIVYCATGTTALLASIGYGLFHILLYFYFVIVKVQHLESWKRKRMEEFEHLITTFRCSQQRHQCTDINNIVMRNRKPYEIDCEWTETDNHHRRRKFLS